MKRIKKFFKAFTLTVCLLSPTVMAAHSQDVLHSECYYYWFFLYFITFPLAYVIIDE